MIKRMSWLIILMMAMPPQIYASTVPVSYQKLTRGVIKSRIHAMFFTPKSWYVDPVAGGPRCSAAAGAPTNCANGLGTTAFNPSGGSNQNSPYRDGELLWNDPFTFADEAWVISGGDTVNFNCTAANPCKMAGSISGSIPSGTPCFGISQNCVPPPVPSGPDAAHPTIFQGVNCSAGCAVTVQALNTTNSLYATQQADPTKVANLWAGGGAFFALSVQDEQHVDLVGLDITDHSACGPATISCTGTEWATNGIYSGNSTTPTNGDINLTDVRIHGMQTQAIEGNIGGTWNLLRVLMRGNAQANWEFDPGGGQASNGTVNATSLGFEFGGGGEEYPIVDPIPFAAGSLTSQDTSGYGDCVGTPVTGPINWNMNKSWSIYCTQDALDLGHTHNSTINVINSFFFGSNGGNGIKSGPNSTVFAYNDIFIGNCNRLSAPMTGTGANYNSQLSNYCRANTTNGVNVNTNSTLIADAANDGGTASVSCSGTTCTSGNSAFLSSLTVGQSVVQDCQPASTARTVATVPSNTTFTINTAFPAGGGSCGSHIVKVESSPASTTLVQIYHSTMINYSAGFDNQCQTANPQNQISPTLCPGYTWDYRDNIELGIVNSLTNPGAPPTLFNDSVAATLEDYNDCFNVNGSQCTNTHDITTDPQLTTHVSSITSEAQLDNFDARQTSSSPTKNTGFTIAGQTTDFFGSAWSSPPSMGAIEFGALPVTIRKISGRVQVMGKSS